MPQEEYRGSLEEAIEFLEGRESELTDRLRTRMADASAALRFEEAARLRDQLLAVEKSLEKQRVLFTDLTDRDVFGLFREGPDLVLQVLLVRGGKLVDAQSFPFRGQEFPSEEILSSFLSLYYEQSPAPDEVLLPFEPAEAEALSEVLSERRGRRVRLLTPQRGAKAVSWRRRPETRSRASDPGRSTTSGARRRFQALTRALHLARPPRWVECYDISTFQGALAVGSGVSLKDGEPDKANYRRYKVKGVSGQDDFAMLYEVITRRLRRALAEEAFPDLLVIDGGKGQLNAALAAARDLAVPVKPSPGNEGAPFVEMVGLAKSRLLDAARLGTSRVVGRRGRPAPQEGAGRAAALVDAARAVEKGFLPELERSAERVFLPGRKDPVVLRQNSAELFLLTRLRDEAHRFAITFHRRLRRERNLRSVLEEIPGWGKGGRSRSSATSARCGRCGRQAWSGSARWRGSARHRLSRSMTSSTASRPGRTARGGPWTSPPSPSTRSPRPPRPRLTPPSIPRRDRTPRSHDAPPSRCGSLGLSLCLGPSDHRPRPGFFRGRFVGLEKGRRCPMAMEERQEKAAADQVALAPVVDELCRAATSSFAIDGRVTLPSREAVLAVVEDLRAVLFPGYFGTSDLHDESLHYFVGATLARALGSLEEQVGRGIAFTERHEVSTCAHCGRAARTIVKSFLGWLPDIRRLCASDVEAAYEGDPALKSRDEAIFAYPGIFAVTSQRLAHALHELGVPLIPRIITEHAHTLTGIDIHPGARIGERFFIDHGTGVVIGETSIIGRNVRLYQGVTLGAKSFPLDEGGKPIKGIDRHPIVEDDVVVYAGATILGRVVIGKGSSIGGNVWLTASVPPGSRITQAESREMRFANGGGI